MARVIWNRKGGLLVEFIECGVSQWTLRFAVNFKIVLESNSKQAIQ